MDLEGKPIDSETCQAAARAGAGGIERFQGDMIARRKRVPLSKKSEGSAFCIHPRAEWRSMDEHAHVQKLKSHIGQLAHLSWI